jgi:hypothetical protein
LKVTRRFLVEKTFMPQSRFAGRILSIEQDRFGEKTGEGGKKEGGALRKVATLDGRNNAHWSA